MFIFSWRFCRTFPSGLRIICDRLLLTDREVFKAKHRQTGKKVALKKVLMENEKEGVRNRILTRVLLGSTDLK